MAMHENLKAIVFEGEMLPKWAQLLDLAARLCALSQETQSWFSKFTASSGVDEARTALTHSQTLLSAVRQNKDTIRVELQESPNDGQASVILAAWEYSLESMVQQAVSSKTFSWQIEGQDDSGEGHFGEGDISLRRV